MEERSLAAARGLDFLAVGGICLFLPLAFLFALFTTGEVPLYFPARGSSWLVGKATPFTSLYYFCLIFYSASFGIGLILFVIALDSIFDTGWSDRLGWRGLRRAALLGAVALCVSAIIASLAWAPRG